MTPRSLGAWSKGSRAFYEDANTEAAGRARRLFISGINGRGLRPALFGAMNPLSLRLGALDPDPAEAGVFDANIFLQLLLFDIERLERVYVRKL
jgi:hypothetical protein